MKKLGLLFLCCLHFSCSGQQAKKINGVSFVGSRDRAEQGHVNPILELNANYVAIMPFGFVQSPDSPRIFFDTDGQWYGETKKGAEQYIRLLQKNGIKVMVKPQIWIWKGKFTGDMAMKSEADWKSLEKSYRKFILNHARLAQETQSEIFCIGTELEKFVKNRPEYWDALIREIKKTYHGKLTYAANWDEYSNTPFWKELDFIGIDAYFPLSDERIPTLSELKLGWRKWKTELAEVSQKKDRPILFTEFGYRSMEYTAKKPWLVDHGEMNVNLKAQADATKAVLEEFWKENWFVGGFVWKWFIHHDRSGGAEDNRFTPQNKPAEVVIRNFYDSYRTN